MNNREKRRKTGHSSTQKLQALKEKAFLAKDKAAQLEEGTKLKMALIPKGWPKWCRPWF